MVYDQDFSAKNDLTIAPAETTAVFHTASSFADPVITQNTFSVDNGVTAYFTAGDKIDIKPGVHMKAGCTSYGYIDPNLCSNSSSKIAQTGNSNPPKETTVVIKKENKILDSAYFKLSPNPTNGDVKVSYNLPLNTLDRFELYNYTGVKECNYSLTCGINSISISLNNLNDGVYFYQVLADNKLIAKDKIVVIK